MVDYFDRNNRSNSGLGFRITEQGGAAPTRAGLPPTDFSFINDYRKQVGLELKGSRYAGMENNDEILTNLYIVNDPRSSWAAKEAAQDRLDTLMFLDGPGNGPSGPTTAQNAAGIKAELENLAGLFGLPEQDWSEISFQAASNNWNAAMIRDAVANAISLDSGKREGLVKNVITKSRDVAANYMVNVGDEEALGWAKKIARGEMEEESIVASIRDRAKAQYYWLAPAIDQGVTLKEYFQPHRETIAKLMEVSAESVDFMNNPTWNKVVRYAPPDQEGLREMNLGEVEKYVRQQDGWKATSNAKATAAGAAASIGRIFGAL